MTRDNRKQVLKRLKWRHAVVFALIILLALLTLVFSGRVSGTLGLFGPSSQTVNNITYVSGGIGKSEATLMKALANDYQLEVVFIKKLGEREEYIADVRVQVLDEHLNSLLDIQTEGPYLLADMPKGRYLVTAEYEGVVKKQWASISGGKHQRLVFWWSISEVNEPDDSEPDTSGLEDNVSVDEGGL